MLSVILQSFTSFSNTLPLGFCKISKSVDIVSRKDHAIINVWLPFIVFLAQSLLFIQKGFSSFSSGNVEK